jgi:hypothetical protein
MPTKPETTNHYRSSDPHQIDDYFFILFFGICFCMGLLFFCLGLHAVHQLSEFKDRNRKTIGIVSNHFGSTEITVTFRDEAGKEIYALPVNVYLQRPAIGSRIRLWYNPAQPLEVVAQGGMPQFMQGGILALLIFGGIGAAGFYFVWRQRQLRLWLYDYGRIIEAAFVRSYWFGRRHGTNCYKIISKWTDPDSGISYTFSGVLWGKSRLDQIKRQQFVPVLIDPDNPKRFYIDLPE